MQLAMMNEPVSSVQYVLDTDIVTYQQRGHEQVISKLQQIDRSSVATTVITMYEQMRGRLAAINRKQSDEQLQLAFFRLQATQQYFCTAKILPFDDKAAETYQTLLAQKTRIGAQDLKIAAVVLANRAVLVTSNRRHFDQVPDLQIENWTRT